jgi:hypothetical protein
MSRDCCAPCRKGCNGFMSILAANRSLAALIAGGPVLYILGFVIYYAVNPFPYMAYVSTPAFILFGFIVAAWILAIISLACKFPNVLTISIFVYKALGHWSLVSFLLLLFYGFAQLGSAYDSFLAGGILPQIALLLFCSEVMIASRSRMFREFEAKNAPPPTASIDIPGVSVPESNRALTSAA